MNLKKTFFTSTALLISLGLTAPAFAKQEGMSEEMQAMMAKFKEAGTPAAGHEKLQSLVGEWKTTTMTWMKPGDKPQKSEGSSSIEWILDGRFLQQNFKGEWAGQGFEGLGILGYDNVKQEYVSVWLDSMHTGIAEATGSYSEQSKSLNDEGVASCPISPTKTRNYRSEWKVLNKDKTVFTMYMKDEQGKEFKSMEIAYKRVK